LIEKTLYGDKNGTTIMKKKTGQELYYMECGKAEVTLKRN